jgi:ATP-dependent helicase/nuclease subunit B
VPDTLSVETHHDFAVLEDRLAGILADLKTHRGPLAPALVVVPTRRLIAHLQATLAERCGVLLGVRFHHHDGVTRAIAGAFGLALPRLLGEGTREAIVSDLARRGGGELAAYVLARPGSAAALRRTLEDLREACIDPAAALRVAEALCLSPAARSLLHLHDAYVQALRRLEKRGLSDRAGRVARVLPHATAFAARHEAIVHYGAYELTGSNLDLLLAFAAAGRPVHCLSIGHPIAPAFAYAREFWRTYAGVDPPPIATAEPREARPLADRLPLLYDEDAAPGPSPACHEFAHAQGPAAELQEAARGLLRRRHEGDGTPARIAMIARTLEPYALHIEPVMLAHGLPFHTSATLPASRQPSVRAALALLRCLFADFPAGTLCALMRSGRLRGMADDAPGADVAERLLREHQVAGGRSLIVDRLPAWVEAEPSGSRREAEAAEREAAARRSRARGQSARGLARLVRALSREAEPLARATDHAAWAAACGELLGRRLAGFGPAGDIDDAGVELVRRALADLGALDAAGVPFSPGGAMSAVTRAIDAATLPIGSVDADGTPVPGDGGGVRVLDAMQARGLAFDTVVLIGMNADLFPRRPREDPFLPDADRRALRETLLRPLPVAADGRQEESLLLAHLLGAARRRIVVTWQRADDDGRARAPSLALREVARVTLGSADLAGLGRAATRIQADPAARILAPVRAGEPIAPRDAGLAAAFACRSPVRLRETLQGARAGSPLAIGWDGAPDAIQAGLACLAAIDGEAPGEFDALVGPPGSEPDVWSPSRLETLGSCPQQYFFRHVLHVEEWEAPVGADERDARAIGMLVHEVLRDLYTPHGASGSGGAGDAAAPLRERIAAAWERRGAVLAARVRALYPGLWDLMAAQWIDAIEEFVRIDAAAIASAIEPPRPEHPVETAIPLGGGADDLRLRGRFDRLTQYRDRLVVSDYKTAGRPANHVEAASILKGRRLQMPLYVLLAERTSAGARPFVRAEVLGVGPDFAGADAADRTAALDPERFDVWRHGFLETLAVLRDLARSGLYPLDAASPRCRSCAYARACRRTHPPTLERLRRHPALERFLAMRRKSSKAPTLASVAMKGRP